MLRSVVHYVLSYFHEENISAILVCCLQSWRSYPSWYAWTSHSKTMMTKFNGVCHTDAHVMKSASSHLAQNKINTLRRAKRCFTKTSPCSKKTRLHWNSCWCKQRKVKLHLNGNVKVIYRIWTTNNSNIRCSTGSCRPREDDTNVLPT